MAEIYEQIVAKLVAGGASEDSSHELASYLSLHYPEHAVILMTPIAEPGAVE